MDIIVGVKIHNRFDAILTDAKTGTVKQVAKAENIVCDTFLNNCEMDVYVIYHNYTLYGMQSIVLGTGTGTPKTTDTVLFSQLCHYYGIPYSPGWTRTRIDATKCSFTASITADENTANGNLTEIGLGESARRYSDAAGWDFTQVGIYTHALFTDSEGNPIVIKKTNADKLTITATIYSDVMVDNQGNSAYILTNYRNIYSSVVACDPRIPYVTGDGLYGSYNASVLGSLSGALGSTISFYPMTLPIYNAIKVGGQNTEISKDVNTHTWRATSKDRVLADRINYVYPPTYEIKSLMCGSIQVHLPNEAVYPAKQLTLSAIADGTTADFNFGIPQLNTEDVNVYIDDVLQNKSTYTFNGVDYTHIQGWKSFDSLYLDSFDLTAVNWYPGDYNNYYRTAWPVFNGSTDYSNREVAASEIGIYVYDFKSDYTVTAVGKYLPTGIITYGTPTKFVPRLYYSSDKENWTQVTGLWDSVSAYQNSNNISTVGGYISIEPISARYWKVENPIVRIGSSEISNERKQLCCSIAFDDPKPQLRFNFVPSAGATIKITAYCPYPIKNANWIIESGMTFDVTIAHQ